MSDALLELINQNEEEKEKKGTRFTPAEIYQQPEMWIQTLNILEGQRDKIAAFLGGETDRRFLLTGAGTSAFIGLCLEALFNKVGPYEAKAVGTTEIITDPEAYLRPGGKYFLVHFARSGNSPESVGTFVLGEESRADVKHIVITCNNQGKLALMGRQKQDKSLIVLLPEATNDKSLAMTSSFSSMVVAGQYIASMGERYLLADAEGNYLSTNKEGDPLLAAYGSDGYAKIAKALAEGGHRIMVNYSGALRELCREKFDRAVFLGSNTLAGCAKECHLKLQEETDGKVVAKFDTFLGLRHGPEAVINDRTLVVYLLSEEPLVRRYELDLMEGVRHKGIGMKKIAVCKQADSAVRDASDLVIEHGCDIPDDYQSPAYVIVGQSLGVFKSLDYGLKPDSPSEKGVITRVVQGVKIYDRPAFYADRTLKVIAG